MAKATESNPNPYPSIYKKIRWGIGVPTVILFGLFWGMLYWAENQMEVISLHHWIDTESARYHRDYQTLGENTPLPNPSEFYTFWSQDAVPEWLNRYDSPGFYAHRFFKEEKHFLVTPHPSGSGLLYIVFKDEADDYLDAYETILHLTTVGLGALVGLGMLLYSLYFIRTLSAPLNQLEEKIRRMPDDQFALSVDTSFRETREIEHALNRSQQAIRDNLQREQDFSRFASHELRTPIMVIKGSSELLNKIDSQPPIARKAIRRIAIASDDMSLLTDAFLNLGKENIEPETYEAIELSPLFAQLSQQLLSVNANQMPQCHFSFEGNASIHAPQSFVTIVFNNLLKNAINYSSGDIRVNLKEEQLTISNPFDDQYRPELGYGVGLTIVQRVCSKMGWVYQEHNELGHYYATVTFKKVNKHSETGD
ncbi:sensor histidine kinase [Vibrio mexicanus]|uniref:sensor histidine kinase n=1 Tax=Vibrio mexicanus TaxID=1004326 RepID=UPI00063C2FD4|nr:HAMP domain-containing sensor histidine kinase [Vibrio mexicanus]